MQQEHSEGEAEEEGGEGKETPFFVEAADAAVSAPLTPTVFPQRRPKTYNLEKGQVGEGGGGTLVFSCLSHLS